MDGALHRACAASAGVVFDETVDGTVSQRHSAKHHDISMCYLPQIPKSKRRHKTFIRLDAETVGINLAQALSESCWCHSGSILSQSL